MQLHKIVEVREGQLTDSFEKFPYEEVKDQSLSLIFEEESKKLIVRFSVITNMNFCSKEVCAADIY